MPEGGGVIVELERSGTGCPTRGIQWRPSRMIVGYSENPAIRPVGKTPFKLPYIIHRPPSAFSTAIPSPKSGLPLPKNSRSFACGKFDRRPKRQRRHRGGFVQQLIFRLDRAVAEPERPFRSVDDLLPIARNAIGVADIAERLARRRYAGRGSFDSFNRSGHEARVPVQDRHFESDLQFSGRAIAQKKSVPQRFKFHAGRGAVRGFAIHGGGFSEFEAHVERTGLKNCGTVTRHVEDQLLERVEVPYGKGAEPFGGRRGRVQTDHADEASHKRPAR